jgi:energy-coupling factor transporter ATP-binding protein EcfA2
VGSNRTAPPGTATPDGAISSVSIDYTTLEQDIQPLISLIEATTALDNDRAKTVIYYAIATYGLPKLEKCPVLAIYGPAGTGKTTILQILQAISYRPTGALDGKMTKAALRDSLKDETTALIDEADNIHEEWLVNRYSRQSASTTVKQSSFGEWQQIKRNLFGATALHRRQPFKDPAILSRSIVLSTKSKKGGVKPFKAEHFKSYADVLASVAETVDWEKVSERGGDRIADTWAPLLEVAELFGGEWSAAFADKEMEKARNDLDLGQQEEPSQAVFQALVALAMSEGGYVKERVPLAEITCHVPDDLGLNSWQIGSLVREWGIRTKNAGGKQYAYVDGKAQLVEVAQVLGIQDEWLVGEADSD